MTRFGRRRVSWQVVSRSEIPIGPRKAALKKLIDNKHSGIAFNKHFDVEGSIVFHHASKLGCEGIVSKRLGSPYRSVERTIGSKARIRPGQP
jgi:bifunctional non-homologous end joining protein LigD